MFTALDISTSGLAAQRVRMVTHSNNIANISTTRNERGEPMPYQRRFVVFGTDDSVGADGASGVKVALVGTENKEPNWRPDPDHPDAVKSGPNTGKVAYPNINMMYEMTDAMEAARAYEANLGAIEISKDLAQQTLRILA